jgi:hypothetical protein
MREGNPISRVSGAVCLTAILKDEDPFVEEWVAYHRPLGVTISSFTMTILLYDDDPRQLLSDIAHALHARLQASMNR